MSNVATVRLASKLAPLVTRLGSGFDGEIIAAVKAIERALKSHKYDWHDFAAWISIPASVTHDSEIIAAVKAIERALKSHKYDWHDFAAWISIPASVTHDSIARGGAPTWDDLDDVLRREWLRAALDCGCLNGWSRNFASDISR